MVWLTSSFWRVKQNWGERSLCIFLPAFSSFPYFPELLCQCLKEAVTFLYFLNCFACFLSSVQKWRSGSVRVWLYIFIATPLISTIGFSWPLCYVHLVCIICNSFLCTSYDRYKCHFDNTAPRWSLTAWAQLNTQTTACNPINGVTQV